MTRKDYIAIAHAIRERVKPGIEWAVVPDPPTRVQLAAILWTAEAIADAMAADNNRFNRLRFMAACGFEAIS